MKEGQKMEGYFHFDRGKSIEELEGKEWSELDFTSSLATKCYELRKKPIYMFSSEDLRLMIGQEIGLDILVPLALEIIEDDILSEGDLYPGDLLDSLLKVSTEFWKRNSKYENHLEGILTNVINELSGKLKDFKEKNI